MSISHETSRRLEQALEHEKDYQPNADIQRELGWRSLVMVVAPAAMGKTLLMRTIMEQDDRFGMSAVLSTRAPRLDDDPALFRLFEHNDKHINELLDKVDVGTMVQYAIHPTEGTIYGSELQDHPYKHNMLATLSGAIDQLEHVGFANTTVIGLVAPPSDWQKWFNARYAPNDPKRLGRLKEAERSYADLLARDDVHWVINREGQVEDAARDTIAAVDGAHKHDDEALAYVQRIRHLIEDTKREASYTNSHD